jgi:DNA polymerase-3 subunit beta
MTAVAPIPTATKPAKGASAITIQRSALVEALAAIAPAISTKPSLPVLSMVRIAPDGDGVRMMATNIDQAVSRFVPAVLGSAVVEAFLVPAKRLAEIAAALPEGPVKLEPSGHHIRIAAGQASFKLNTTPASEFPTAPDFKPAASLVITAGQIVSLVEHVRFAASTEESRPILNGVLMQIGAAALRAVATNGHRLGVVETPRDDQSTGALAGLIVPPVVFEGIKRLFVAEELVTVSVNHTDNPTRVTFASDRASLSSSLIDGPYPSFEQVIPRDYEKAMTCERNGLISALKRVMPLAAEKTSKVKCALESGHLALVIETPDTGSAEDEIAAIATDAAPFTFGVNGTYLREILTHLPDADVSWAYKAPERATLLTPVSLPPGITRLQYVLMPVRLTD